MDLLSRRDVELQKIFKIGGYGFLGLYGITALSMTMMKGRMPYFRTFMKHSILAGSGTFCAALGAEKVCAELFYNKVMIQLADKYNFTPEEVMDLQRNLNQYYIKKDREADINRE